MIPGVILAAGSSTRMGRPKSLLPTGVPGETFLSRAVTTLSEGGVDDIVVVIGEEPPELRRELDRLPSPVRVATNPEPSRGQLSSLHVALAVVDRPGVAAMLVTLVDLPLLAVETVQAVLAAYRRTHAPVVRPVHQGRHGHPVVFDRRAFDALRAADPSAGAKGVVRAFAGSAVSVPVDDVGAVLDVDTETDYQRAFGRSLPTGGAARGD